MREVFSDLDTPLSVYLKLADGPYTYLLESVEGGENWGRYSIIGLPCQRVYKLHGNKLSVEDHGVVVEQRELADPLGEIERIRATYKVPQLAADAGIQRWSGRLLRFREHRLYRTRTRAWDRPDQLGIPDVLLMLSEEVAGIRQPQGPPVPDRACRSRAAASLCARAPAPGRTRIPSAPLRAELSGSARSEGAGGSRLRVELHARRISANCGKGERVYSRRRHLPGGAVAAPVRAVPRAAGRCVPRAARAESLAVHVFPRSGRHADRRLVAGNPGAPEKRQGRAASDRRHAPARQDPRRRSRARSRTARRPEGARRAPDADRPRPQRRRPRRRDRQRASSPKAS